MRESYGEAEDKRHFRFYYDDQQGKSITMNVSTSDGAYGIVKEFEKFLKACGYIPHGKVIITAPETVSEKLAPREGVIAQAAKEERVAKPSFDFSNIPNNNWLFGTQQIPSLTTADLSGLTVTDVSTMTSQSWSDWTNVNKYPSMAPLTTEQIQSWTTDMPGTLGYPKVKF